MTTDGDIDDKLGPLMDEFLSRKRQGEYPSLSEFVQRHPELEQEIRELFPAVAMMEQAEVSEPLHDGGAAVTPDGTELKRLGDFRIIREIGRGGMGVVYEAIQESLGRHVALKLLPWQSMADSRQVKRFQREARIAASLHHSNIVPVYGVGEADGLHFLAMQYIHGQSLDSVLRELQQLRNDAGARQPSSVSPIEVDVARHPMEDASALSGVSSSLLQSASGSSSHADYFRHAAELMANVADALDYAHSQGVLHRDIKPANLMLDVEKNIWITDFGLARAGDTAEALDTDTPHEADNLTQTGDLIGTLRYLAPERFQGTNDCRSDVYSLGLTLFEFLTLQPAFRAADRATLIREITTSPLPLPRSLIPDIPRDLETIVMKASHPDPRLRYGAAADMAKDLRRFLDDKPIVARRASPWKRCQLWCRRNPAVAALSGLALTLLVMVAIVSSVAAVKLSSRQNELLLSLDRATNAEIREREANDQATENLFEAYAARAKSGREGFRPGRAFDGLEAIANASALRDRLHVDDRQIERLRNEAIACLGLVDVKPDIDRPDPGIPHSFERWGFDSQMERYARVSSTGGIDVMTVEKGDHVAHFSRGWDPLYPPYTRFSSDDRYLAVMGSHDSGVTRLEIWHTGDWTPYLPSVPSSAESFAHAFAFSDDGQLATWIGNNQLIVFDLKSRRVVQRRVFDYSPDFVTFCHSGCHIAIGWGAGVAVFDWRSDAELTVIPHQEYVRDADFSHSGRFLATACYDHMAYVWDLQNPERPIATCSGHTSKVLKAEFSPDDCVLMTTAWDDTTRLWNPWIGNQLLRINRYATGFSKDGKWLGLQETGDSVGRFQFQPAPACRVLSWESDDDRYAGVHGIAFHPDGSFLAHTAGDQVVIRTWPDATVLHVLRCPRLVRNLSFDVTGEFLFAGVDGCMIRWKTDSLAAIDTTELEGTRSEVAGQADVVVEVELTHAADVAFLNMSGGKAYEFDPTSSDLTMGTPLAAEWTDWFVAAKPDGSVYALSGKYTDLVRAFRREDQSEVFRYELPDETAARIDFSPTGHQLLMCARNALHVFDAQTWEIAATIPLRNTGYARAAWSPDGRLLAAHDGEEILLLEADHWTPLARFQNPYGESYSKAGPEAVLGLTFSPDQRYLASGTGTSAHSLYVWDVHEVRRQLGTMKLDWDATPLPAKRSVAVPPADHLGKCFCELPVSSQDRLVQKQKRLEELLSDDPTNRELLYQYATLLSESGLTEEAIAAYDRSLTIKPDDVHVLGKRTWLLLKSRRNKEAARDCERILELSGDDNGRWSWASHTLAWLMLIGEPALRDDDRALQLMEEAVRRTPDDTLVANTYGLALCRAGRFEEAVTVLKANLERPANTSAATDYLCLAWAQHAEGDSIASTEAWNAAMRTWFADKEVMPLNVIEFQRLSREVAVEIAP
ncbi:serine/threonine-protein kinase [Fuerstiella marisgermanici]|uniref:Serine/threonine-protein kinase PrkC n=1 Tax=Fuerstiella marisgermanici TaxID=1891926 RepID=A0A1P8WAP4_9PLAN|nr:serine/threonine-protein kinase [Fuerstiella marisgermanici]APZ91138.1 Serine/threonine-protein kinase PrkC [Fuerstiella marisgermanici]